MNQDTGQASYDSIRKTCLILLKFYDFWVTQLLDTVKNEDKLFNIFDIYVEETNHILVSSGYEELFVKTLMTGFSYGLQHMMTLLAL